MQVVQEPLGPCEVSLQIEVEADKVAQAVEQVYKEFSAYITVPGFRRGKAPMSFVKKRVPEAQLRERTMELLVTPAYEEAISNEAIQPFAQPKLELISLETQPPDQKLQFKAVVPLPPKIEPGQYVGVEVERQRYDITEDAIESRLNSIRDRVADYPAVEGRPAQIGDFVVTDLDVTLDDADRASEPNETVIRLGDEQNLPGLDDTLLGADTGDERTAHLTYPADYTQEELAGKSGDFHFKVKEVREKKVPELDDEFAVKHGDAPTLSAMRVSIRTEAEKQMLDLAQQTMEVRLLDGIVAASTIDYPAVLRDAEVEEEVKEFLKDLERRGSTIDDYLTQVSQTREQLLEQFEARSDRQIRRGLVISEIISRENLQLTDEDYDSELAIRAERQRTTVEAMRAYVEANKQVEAVRNSAQTKKVLGFLTAAAIIKDKVVPLGDQNQLNEASQQETQSGASSETVAAPKPARKRKAKETSGENT